LLPAFCQLPQVSRKRFERGLNFASKGLAKNFSMLGLGRSPMSGGSTL
jgi:hypothetical protein